MVLTEPNTTYDTVGGVYLDGTCEVVIDMGNHTNGMVEWLEVEKDGWGVPTTITAKIREWEPIGFCTSAISSRTSFGLATSGEWHEWEWTPSGGVSLVKVCRGAYDPQSGWIKFEGPSISDRMKQIMQQRCAPMFIRDRKMLDRMPDIREIRARETLRRVIGEEKYRYFLKKGFISVMNPKSGNTFQIFPGHGITNVWFRGKMTERLCVVLRGGFPPTDSLIMRYLLILNNEDQFRSLAVKHEVWQSRLPPREPDRRTLTEIFAAYKRSA